MTAEPRLRVCDACGHHRECVRNYFYDMWEWWCWDCLDEEEDGYAVMLPYDDDGYESESQRAMYTLAWEKLL